ncbi:hypothetical protein QBC36DRAFT_199794, partial [Triangularia setosa]
ASSGIGDAKDAHLVLLAPVETHLKEVASKVISNGATASTHSINILELENIHKLHRLLQDVDVKAEGIDIAIFRASVTGHRNDVLGKNVQHVAAVDNPAQSNGVPSKEEPEDDSDTWGAITASRMLQVNVGANQQFILLA